MRVGILGAGMIGGTVGRLWAQAGHEVSFGVRHPERLRSMLSGLGGKATAGSALDAVAGADAVLAAIPFRAWPGVAAEIAAALGDKVLLDATVPDPPRDGAFGDAALARKDGVAFAVALLLPRAKLVRAFSTVMWTTLQSQAHRAGDRVGIPLAGDDDEAIALAARLVGDAGFDPVVVGPLSQGRRFDPGTSVFDSGMSGPQVRAALGVA
ncbi:NADPH-dependent F420 reductase [Mesorhizobium japonicum]|uniref:Mll2039 protein n=1 Tax=Mesorhizobium japonicum (strain LMG 29417 / CECT 9101 / MAFF 303099) TaxID=266835 RepID=Q98J96_RHILO|nr:NADPH-dependent F420 reductase [Mesorhizobium japonicum]BAB49270.1 mll2039 [Mesorhizobium japonicum MAFF 303099]